MLGTADADADGQKIKLRACRALLQLWKAFMCKGNVRAAHSLPELSSERVSTSESYWAPARGDLGFAESCFFAALILVLLAS